MRVLVLGVTGMLGNAVFYSLLDHPSFSVSGTVRNATAKRYFTGEAHSRILSDVDVLDQDSVVSVMMATKPQVVINCIGLVKQFEQSKDPLLALPINAMLPHRLARLCSLANARLIHVSTDCVFSGSRGMYTEDDMSDAGDLYGKSKYLGELHDISHAITLRTSIIGHGLVPNASLIDWFLAQQTKVKGYERAVFSGLPTVELARVIRDYVIPHPELHGLYHVSAQPIDKLRLLRLVADIYQKQIDIMPDQQFQIDRSLDSSRFRTAVQYSPPDWPTLIKSMHDMR